MELALLCDLLNKLDLGMHFELINGRIEFEVLGVHDSGFLSIYSNSDPIRNRPFDVYIGGISYIDWANGEDAEHTIVKSMDAPAIYALLMMIGDEGWENMITKSEIEELTLIGEENG